MAVAYITEYQKYSGSGTSFQAALEPAQKNQAVAITTTTQSAAFGKNTYLIRVHVDAIACIEVGTNPAAVAGTSKRMAANQTEYFAVLPGQKIAVVTAT